MLNTTIEEAFEINPTITIKRDAEVPFVSMDRLTPGQQDVDAGEIRQFEAALNSRLATLSWPALRHA